MEGKQTHIGCVLCMCQAVCFLKVIPLGYLRDRLFRQSNWVVGFRNVWKRKKIGDKSLIVIAQVLHAIILAWKKGDTKKVFIY